MFAVVLAAALQALAPPPDIVVRGDRDWRERAARADREVDQMLPRTDFDQPLARFQDTLCPGFSGLARASAQAVVNRIGRVADTLGLMVGEPGCEPNLLVIVTADAEATTRNLIVRHSGLFQGQDLTAIRRLRAETGAARGWTAVELRSRDGEAPAFYNRGPRTLMVTGASRIGAGFRYDITHAVVMIDADAARDRATDQIADYAVMRGLANARADRLHHDRTVLAASAAGGDAQAPTTLTDIDWAILRSLYAGPGNRPATLKRAEMVRRIVSDLPGSRPSGRE